MLKPSKWYLCWHSGLSRRLRRASHTCPSSLVIFNWSLGGITCHVPFSNFLNLPEGQKNTGLQGETELRQETAQGLGAALHLLPHSDSGKPLCFCLPQWHSSFLGAETVF